MSEPISNETVGIIPTATTPKEASPDVSVLGAEAASHPSPDHGKAREWQPIETAPKTTKSILVFCSARRNQYTANYRDGEWQHFGGYGALEETPTHWQPLPLPPTTEGEKK